MIRHMTTLQRLFRLIRFYFVMALIGTLSSIVIYGFATLNPVIILSTMLAIVFFLFIKLIQFRQDEERRLAELAYAKGQIENKGRIHHEPPKLAEFLIYITSPKDYREYLLGDLYEEFNEILTNQGLRTARLWYWKQAIIGVFPTLLWRVYRSTHGKEHASWLKKIFLPMSRKV